MVAAPVATSVQKRAPSSLFPNYLSIPLASAACAGETQSPAFTKNLAQLYHQVGNHLPPREAVFAASCAILEVGCRRNSRRRHQSIFPVRGFRGANCPTNAAHGSLESATCDELVGRICPTETIRRIPVARASTRAESRVIATFLRPGQQNVSTTADTARVDACATGSLVRQRRGGDLCDVEQLGRRLGERA